MSDDEFYRMLRRELVGHLGNRGWSLWDAEDAAQAALVALLEHADGARNLRAYAHAVARRWVIADRKRRQPESPSGLDWPVDRVPPSTNDTYLTGDLNILVRECLLLLRNSPHQQWAMALAIDDCRPREIAAELGAEPATTRSSLRHARNKVRPLRTDDANDLGRLQVLHDIYDAYRRREQAPVAPRPVIARAWARAERLGLDAKKGATVPAVGSNELEYRRDRSQLAIDWAPVRARLDDLATEAGCMSVIADPDGVVLWRGGDPTIMAVADGLKFGEGAQWSFARVGPGGIALALLSGTMVAVHRFEHFVETQHGLSCVATPVRDPRDGRRWVLNLTGTQPTFHRAILRELDTIARDMVSRPAPRRGTGRRG